MALAWPEAALAFLKSGLSQSCHRQLGPGPRRWDESMLKGAVPQGNVEWRSTRSTETAESSSRDFVQKTNTDIWWTYIYKLNIKGRYIIAKLFHSCVSSGYGPCPNLNYPEEDLVFYTSSLEVEQTQIYSPRKVYLNSTAPGAGGSV
ncbi:hypothetical protein B0F90DRAFT_1671722 [Multifurca ochricompacta]|uniref:Uncharacterized protein n=1 Tax=Multifurca ochricompacta TaxID=376703 RepID=A0AAD4LUR0_9AGAM|nr:hypothetical protein B0F90DRAFT_1671722 [Multifurca ochricompacta]